MIFEYLKNYISLVQKASFNTTDRIRITRICLYEVVTTQTLLDFQGNKYFVCDLKVSRWKVLYVIATFQFYHFYLHKSKTHMLCSYFQQNEKFSLYFDLLSPVNNLNRIKISKSNGFQFQSKILRFKTSLKKQSYPMCGL